MTVGEARNLAEQLGYRLEKLQGRDEWIVRAIGTDYRVAHGLTFAGVVAWLERASQS